jgi:hypothetical protein
MKRNLILLFSLLLVIGLCALSFANPSMAQEVGQPDLLGAGSDSNPVGMPEVIIPEMYRSASNVHLGASAIKGTAVYFTPQDENTSATVIFLYSTNATATTVGLQSFNLDGSLVIDTTISVPAHGLVRICSDTVSTASASWANSVLVNFTTFSTYAIMTLPRGVKAEGFVVYNPSGTYDPLTETQMLPLRFSVKATTSP